MASDFLSTSTSVFRSYKLLGERAMEQISDEALSLSVSTESNSIAVIVRHLQGNMLSRWTDFLSSDGEKEWRERDAEFEVGRASREQLMAWWNEGWDCLFQSMAELNEDDLTKTIRIRAEKHSVVEAIVRQLTHTAYHVGQIVYVAKMLSPLGWNSLTVPRGQSKQFDAEMRRKHDSQ